MQPDARAQTQATELPMLVVSATRTEQPLEEVGSSMTVITGADMEARQLRFVADALRTVPGLAVTRSGGMGASTQVRIRGAEANQTKVLIDGVEVNDPAFGSEFDFANLLTADIERIEVLRGPQSVLYGSDAVGGVINVITRDGGGPLHGSTGIEGGSFRTLQGNSSLGGALANERLRYFLSATRLRSDGISRASEDRGNTERDEYGSSAIFAKLGMSPSDRLDLDMVGHWRDISRDGDTYIGGVGAVDAREDDQTLQRFGRLQGRMRFFDDIWHQRLGISGAETRTDYLTDGQRTSSFDGTRTKLDYQSDLYLSSTSLLPADHVISFGIDHIRDSAVTGSAFSNFDESIATDGFYGLYQLTLFDDLFLTAGARHDANDRFEDADTYRGTLAYWLSQTGTKLRGSYGTAVKNPSLFQLYGYTSTFQPNPNLTPEKSRGWDIGVDQQLIDNRLMLTATYFDQRMKNFIGFAGQTVVNTPGVSRARGLELGAEAAITSALSATATYTLTVSEDAAGNELARRPKHQGSANVAYRFLEGRATANLGLVAVGARNDLTFDAVYNSSIVGLDPYLLVNLALSYRITDAVEMFGRIENLTDERYEDVFTYGEPGRAGYAGLRLRY